MQDISCPHCGKAFKVDETSYADILKQVHDSEFERLLRERLDIAAREKRDAVELAETKAAGNAQKAAAEKDATIASLQAKLDGVDVRLQLAVSDAVCGLKEERDSLSGKLTQANQEKLSAVRLAELTAEKTLSEAVAERNATIQKLEATIVASTTAQTSAVREAVITAEKDRDKLQADLEKADLKHQLSEQCLKDKYETQIEDRNQEIERLRDFKARLSTKMIGETLEQHCEIEFNRLRATAFPKAYFEKDNDARAGSKGDYIFRDLDEIGTEIVSIMFEMKNEDDRTATKGKNEDFLRQLDKNRVEKGCEYAVLVSLLEPENELYNMGIVDVFHRFPKMYVIRPQFFIQMVTLLRNAAMKSLQYKTELAFIKTQNIDISNFEAKLTEFKNGFAKNYNLASTKFQAAIEEIDKSILHLQKTKDALLGTDRNLRLANDKAQDVTIRRLTRNNPTMTARFSELKSDSLDSE